MSECSNFLTVLEDRSETERTDDDTSDFNELLDKYGATCLTNAFGTANGINNPHVCLSSCINGYTDRCLECLKTADKGGLPENVEDVVCPFALEALKCDRCQKRTGGACQGNDGLSWELLLVIIIGGFVVLVALAWWFMDQRYGRPRRRVT